MIKLYTPSIEDLWFKEKMLSDENTMSYNLSYGGKLLFPKHKWQKWYNLWLINHENKRFYRYVTNNDIFIGEVAYHYEDNSNLYVCDVLIYAPYRNKGYGTKALLLLCECAKSNGIKKLYDYIAIDNPAITLFNKCGFIEVARNNEHIIVKKDL